MAKTSKKAGVFERRAMITIEPTYARVCAWESGARELLKQIEPARGANQNIREGDHPKVTRESASAHAELVSAPKASSAAARNDRWRRHPPTR